MPPKAKAPKGKSATDIRALIDLTKTTQDLLAHFVSSLNTPALLSSSSPALITSANASPSTSAPNPNPLDVLKATTTLLKSHTTTLSLLLLTPPLTPSAIISKIGDVTSGVLSGMVAAASDPQLGSLMQAEVRMRVRLLLGTWGEVLTLILKLAEPRQKAGSEGGDGSGKKKDTGPTEAEKQDILATTGKVWEACDALWKVCADGIVGVVVRKAQEWRSVLLDAVEELKEWGEDVDEEDEEDDEDGDEDKAEHSDEEDGGAFGDEDDIFGAANKLGKGDKELKSLLDSSVKRLKLVGILYQAVVKRRLKTFPGANGTCASSPHSPTAKLDELMGLLKDIPETVDDLASAFYDLDEDEANETLSKCGDQAKRVVDLLRLNWVGKEDEFTEWSGKWMANFEGS